MLRKITIVVDCVDDNERNAVQRVANDISSLKILSGKRILGVYPYFRKHEGEIYQLLTMVGNNGLKGLLSAQGIGIMTKLARG